MATRVALTRLGNLATVYPLDRCNFLPSCNLTFLMIDISMIPGMFKMLKLL